MKKINFLVIFVAFVLFISCSAPVTFVEVQSFEARSTKLTPDKAFDAVTMILVNRGFDIKMSNKDVGLITTEYKKFASTGGNPPFDLYIQIKAVIQDIDGKVNVKLSPIVKEQNRINAAAFTEHELSYYTGDPKNVALIKSMKKEGWRSEAQIIFMNVVNDVAQSLGISVEEVKQNVTKTQKNAVTITE
jgi:uncharacterized lipoprotein